MMRALGFGVLALWLTACSGVVESRDIAAADPMGFEPTIGAEEPASPKIITLNEDTPIAVDPWDATTPAGPADYSTTSTVYDAGMREVPLEFRFRRVAQQAWHLHLLSPGANAPVERAKAHFEFIGDSGLTDGRKSECLAPN